MRKRRREEGECRGGGGKEGRSWGEGKCWRERTGRGGGEGEKERRKGHGERKMGGGEKRTRRGRRRRGEDGRWGIEGQQTSSVSDKDRGGSSNEVQHLTAVYNLCRLFSSTRDFHLLVLNFL